MAVMANIIMATAHEHGEQHGDWMLGQAMVVPGSGRAAKTSGRRRATEEKGRWPRSAPPFFAPRRSTTVASGNNDWLMINEWLWVDGELLSYFGRCLFSIVSNSGWLMLVD